MFTLLVASPGPKIKQISYRSQECKKWAKVWNGTAIMIRHEALLKHSLDPFPLRYCRRSMFVIPLIIIHLLCKDINYLFNAHIMLFHVFIFSACSSQSHPSSSQPSENILADSRRVWGEKAITLIAYYAFDWIIFPASLFPLSHALRVTFDRTCFASHSTVCSPSSLDWNDTYG